MTAPSVVDADRVVSIPAEVVREEMDSRQNRRERSLTDCQRRMIREVCEALVGVLVIEGGAGTGRTAAAESPAAHTRASA
jgi:hypothetical protein